MGHLPHYPRRVRPVASSGVTRSGSAISSLLSARLESPDSLPALRLARTTVAEYCETACRASRNEFWWYFNGLTPFSGSSRPFPDEDGRWWYRVKPTFAWPVDFFQPMRRFTPRAPGRWLAGWQWPVRAEEADSRVGFNVVLGLPRYELAAIAPAKRRAVMRGMRELEIATACAADVRTAREACEVWNDHVRRTGWNREMTERAFEDSWRELNEWPGTTLITARRRREGTLCAWMIVRCLDHTLFIDTVASHSERLAERPNDAMIFATLMAGRRGGLRHAQYSRVSRIVDLERFKRSLGFVPHAFPARLRLRRAVAWALRRWRPDLLERLFGDPPTDDEAGSTRQKSLLESSKILIGPSPTE